MAIKLTLLGIHVTLLLYLLAQKSEVFRPKAVYGTAPILRDTGTEKISEYLKFRLNSLRFKRYFYNSLIITCFLYAFFIMFCVFLTSILGDVLVFSGIEQTERVSSSGAKLEYKVVEAQTGKIRKEGALRSYVLMDGEGQAFDIEKKDVERVIIYVGKERNYFLLRIREIPMVAGVFGIFFAIACSVFLQISREASI